MCPFAGSAPNLCALLSEKEKKWIILMCLFKYEWAKRPKAHSGAIPGRVQQHPTSVWDNIKVKNTFFFWDYRKNGWKVWIKMNTQYIVFGQWTHGFVLGRVSMLCWLDTFPHCSLAKFTGQKCTSRCFWYRMSHTLAWIFVAKMCEATLVSVPRAMVNCHARGP